MEPHQKANGLVTNSNRRFTTRIRRGFSRPIWIPRSPGSYVKLISSKTKRSDRPRALPPPTLTNQPPVLAHTGQRAKRLSRQGHEFRQEYIALQESGVWFLPHAVCRIQRIDPVGQSDDGGVSRIVSVSGRQADRAEIHLFTQFPGTQFQRSPERLFWRKLLGFASDRL